MLTDIFAYRYKDVPIWNTYTEDVRRLLNQSIGILKEVFPYFDSAGNVRDKGKETWTQLHAMMCRELGVKELSPTYYSYQTTYMNQPRTQSGFHTMDYVCESFMIRPPTSQEAVDAFVKQRLSLVEIGLRRRGMEVLHENAQFDREMLTAKANDSGPRRVGVIPGSAVTGLKARFEIRNRLFDGQVAEFNERLRRAGAPLTYHNGFIQLTNDSQIEKEVAAPFWELVAEERWKNVSIDMSEALDQRDSGGKDPAFFAAKALESTIKIISNMKGWTTGKEVGASNFIDNLSSKNNGRFIDSWEADVLRDYFKKVRNTVGHGPGDEPMPVLSREQTNWAIEAAMSWTRSLIRRM